MDKRKIYNLLCKVIEEAELGKKSVSVMILKCGAYAIMHGRISKT